MLPQWRIYVRVITVLQCQPPPGDFKPLAQLRDSCISYYRFRFRGRIRVQASLERKLNEG